MLLIGRTVQLGIGQSRLSSVSILTIDDLFTNSISRIKTDQFSLASRLFNHRKLIIAKEYIGGYTDHFNPNFLFVTGDGNNRHHASGHSLLYWWTLPLLISGIYYLLKSKNHLAKKAIFAQLLIAPTASALTAGTPNAVRSIFFLPAFQILTALGIVHFISWLKSQKTVIYTFSSLIVAVFISINIALYFHNYYIHTPRETSQAWQYGYKQVVDYVNTQKQNYEKVLFTTAYDQPYIYFFWYGKHSPQVHNPGDFNQKYGNIEFREINWYEDIKFKNTLIIASPREVKDSSNILWQTNFLDGSPAFIAVKSLN